MHNAQLWKAIGYYYPANDVVSGAQQVVSDVRHSDD